MTQTFGEVGEYQLDRVIGRGGMAKVWRVSHAQMREPLALKVMSQKTPSDSGAAAFMDEIRALAGLQHPGVVYLHDYGFVTGSEAKRLQVAPGTPYYVSEYLKGGTLKVNPAARWEQLRGWLLETLDALAFVHARGVVHRDLKPENIMLTSDGRLKIGDFGLSKIRRVTRRTTPDLLKVSGTPKYMAPEQITASWRDHGPWTDLYAVGCICYKLASGRAPFQATSSVEVMRAHLESEAPPLVPLFPVPQGLEAWAKVLLRKNPHQRYECVADAANALKSLGEAAATTPYVSARILDDDEPTIQLMPTTLEVSQFGVVGEALEVPPAPIASWQRAHVEMPIGIAPSLFGVRKPALSGRESERATMWKALMDVRAHGRTGGIVLHGEQGIGKSAIAHDILQRVQELGYATVLRAEATESGADRVIPDLLNRFLRLEELNTERVFERLNSISSRLSLLFSSEVDGVAKWTHLIASIVSPSPGGQLSEDAEIVGCCRILAELSRRRPVVVMIDDAHVSPVALRLLRSFLDSYPECPLLFVMTVRSDHVAQAFRIRATVRQLIQHERVQEISVLPLAESEQRSLIEGYMAGGEDLTEHVLERTQGNPLFAVQLIKEWVESKHLIPLMGGLTPLDAETLRIPEGIDEVWEDRIRRIVLSFDDPDAVRKALALAACWGGGVRFDDWSRSAAKLGEAVPSGLAARLLDLGLARATTGGFRFEHESLRSNLVSWAKRSGHWIAMNLVCADVCVRQADDTIQIQRRGEFWFEAQEFRLALETFAQCVVHWDREESRFRAEAALELHREAIIALALPDTDPSVVFNRAHRAASGWRAAGPAGLAELRKFAEIAEDGGALAEGVRLRRSEAFVVRSESVDKAIKVLERVLALYPEMDDHNAVTTRTSLAFNYSAVGRRDLQFECLKEAMRVAEGSGLGYLQVEASFGLVEYHLQFGQYQEAKDLLDRCEKQATDVNQATLWTRFHSASGELYRFTGQLKKAREAYLAALNGMAVWPSLERALKLNLALTELEAGCFEEANSYVEEIVQQGRLHAPLFDECAALIQAGYAARQGDLESWTRHRTRAQEIHRSEFLARDFALCLEFAAVSGGPISAPGARILAAAAVGQWERLGRTSKEKRLRAMILTWDVP